MLTVQIVLPPDVSITGGICIPPEEPAELQPFLGVFTVFSDHRVFRNFFQKHCLFRKIYLKHSVPNSRKKKAILIFSVTHPLSLKNGQMQLIETFCSFLRKYHFSRKICLAQKYLDLICDKKCYNKKKESKYFR